MKAYIQNKTSMQLIENQKLKVNIKITTTSPNHRKKTITVHHITNKIIF